MELVRVEVNPPGALITLDRPRVRNALSPALIDDLQEALDQVEARDGVAAVVLTGSGEVFCAGADLTVLGEMTRGDLEAARQDSARLMRLYQRIHAYPKPVVAAVGGAALGGGCGLASACDLVLASERAVFAYGEVRLGFVPALAGVFLARIAGEKRVKELFLTGRTFTAQEAWSLGLVNRVVPHESLPEEAREVVRTLARHSPSALRLTKELVNSLYGISLREALELGLQVNALARGTADFREGVASFLEKRPPRWGGGEG
jgi:methylglutaconyl-CoA hydratase